MCWLAGFRKNGVDWRQTEPRHRIDDRDFGMVEDWVGEPDRISGRLWQERRCGNEGDDAGGSKSPYRNGQRRFSLARRTRLQKRKRGYENAGASDTDHDKR